MCCFLPVLLRVRVQEEVEDAEGPTPEGTAAREGETRERHRALQLQAVEILLDSVLSKPVHRRQSRGHQRLGSGPAALPTPRGRTGRLQYDHGDAERRRRELRFVVRVRLQTLK